MKTSLIKALASCITVLSLASCVAVSTLPENKIPEKPQSSSDVPAKEDSPLVSDNTENSEADQKTSSGTENENTEVKDNTSSKADSEDELLSRMGAVINTSLSIDETADSFMQNLKSGNKEAVASAVGGDASYYSFLEDSQITSYTLSPIEITVDGEKYTNEYTRSYLCEINVAGTSNIFTDIQSLYYLETADFSMFNNPVTCFMPFEDAIDIINPDFVMPEKYIQFTQQLTDAYCPAFETGENTASSLDFNNIAGFHFIPHLMFYFENNPSYDRPHSMTAINEFIGKCFFDNGGITLSSDSDYELWISDSTGYDDYSKITPDDEVFGCFNGHGGSWAIMRICGYEETKSGVNITVQTYSDYSFFAKSKNMIFKYAPEVDGEAPQLYSIEVVENTGYPEAYGSV